MRRALTALVALGLLAAVAVPASARNSNAENSYTVTVLQSNESDHNLVNGWGITASGTSPWWVSNNGTSTSTLYDGTGSPRPLVVTIPGPPTGTVFNGTNDFKVDTGTGLSASRFLFATDDGRIAGWNGVGTAAIQAAATPGAIYLGLAIGSSGGNNYLYAANFVDAGSTSSTGRSAWCTWPGTSPIPACQPATRHSASSRSAARSSSPTRSRTPTATRSCMVRASASSTSSAPTAPSTVESPRVAS